MNKYKFKNMLPSALHWSSESVFAMTQKKSDDIKQSVFSLKAKLQKAASSES